MPLDPEQRQVREGDLLWSPGPERVAAANLTTYQRWLREQRGLAFDGYQALWEWSVSDLDAFWGSIWAYLGVRASVAPERVLGRREMPGAQWFPGARLNYAEHVLGRERPGADALLHAGEETPMAGLPWEVLGGRVRALGTWLREQGVRPGDRVVAWMPNLPATVVAMLATTALLTPLEWQRYYLPAYPAVGLLAASGFVWLARHMMRRYRPATAVAN